MRLIHRIGTIEWRDLGDTAAAIATYRAALEGDADDAEANAALEELYAQAELWDDLYALFEERLVRVGGDAARKLRAKLAEIAAGRGDPDRARVQCARLLEDPQLTAEQLDAVGRASDSLGDVDLARAVLRRHAELTQDAGEQVTWLERIGDLEGSRRSDVVAAADAWKKAAGIAEGAGYDDAARRPLRTRARRGAVGPRGRVAPRPPERARGALAGAAGAVHRARGRKRRRRRARGDYAPEGARPLRSPGRPGREGPGARSRSALAMAPGRADVSLETFERMSVAAGRHSAPRADAGRDPGQGRRGAGADGGRARRADDREERARSRATRRAARRRGDRLLPRHPGRLALRSGGFTRRRSRRSRISSPPASRRGAAARPIAGGSSSGERTTRPRTSASRVSSTGRARRRRSSRTRSARSSSTGGCWRSTRRATRPSPRWAASRSRPATRTTRSRPSARGASAPWARRASRSTSETARILIARTTRWEEALATIQERARRRPGRRRVAA